MRSSTRPTVPTTTWPPGLELRLLRADRRAAEHGDGVDAACAAVGAQRLRDLDAQLARRRQHERLDVRVVGVDELEHRQPERGRLAGAGLRLADHVAPVRAAPGSPAPGSGWATRSRRRAGRRARRLGEPEVGEGRSLPGRSSLERGRVALSARVEQELAGRAARLQVLVGAPGLGERIRPRPRRPAARRARRARRARAAARRPARPAPQAVHEPEADDAPAARASARRWRPRWARARRSRRRRAARTARARRGTASNTPPPAISSTTSTRSPWLASTQRVGEVLAASTSTAASAPSSSASARLSSLEAVAITRPAPSGAPSWTASDPTPPAAACTTTLSPGAELRAPCGRGATRSGPAAAARARPRRRHAVGHRERGGRGRRGVLGVAAGARRARRRAGPPRSRARRARPRPRPRRPGPAAARSGAR